MRSERGWLPLLETRDIRKRFGEVDALHNLSFRLPGSGIVGLIGPNGSGKTTLMEVVAGLLPATSGEVLWNGKPLRPAERKNVLFYIPDGVVPYEEQAVGDTLRFFSILFSTSKSQLKRAVEGLELGQVLGKRAGHLSKGFRRRLLLAIALLAPQPYLFLDEPFDGFDLKQTLRVMDLLREVQASGKTLFLSIHQLKDAERACDHLVLLSQGKLVATGNLSALRSQANLPAADLEGVFLALT
jgi:ABC-2 type transport system ATP-binding protein